jgi:hypothetical protein
LSPEWLIWAAPSATTNEKRRLTRNVGYPKLREHLGAAVALMKISRDYFDFIDKLDQHYPRFGEQYRLPFPYEQDLDDGKGL